MTTVVYANTDLPYAEWKPAYVILSKIHKGIFLPFWMPWETYQQWKPEADKIATEYWKGGRFGKRTIHTSRWRKDICEAIASIINSNVEGLRCTVEYPEWESNPPMDRPSYGHVRLFHLERG